VIATQGKIEADGQQRMISIRPMAATDAAVVRELLFQLGYDLEVRNVARRLEAVTEARDHTVVVAEQDGRVVAFLHVFGRPALEKPPEAIVQALVVDQARRGAGIGKALMAAAEAWALDRGFATVAVSSSVARVDAHAFYNALGYRREATSYLLRRRLR
jgi:GNAT superfamily N-acetyltransferase